MKNVVKEVVLGSIKLAIAIPMAIIGMNVAGNLVSKYHNRVSKES